MLSRSRLEFIVLLGFIASIAAAKAPQGDSEDRPLDRVRVVDISAPSSWSGLQVVAADRKGRLFVLRSETLEVYKLDEDLRPWEPIQLQHHGLDLPQQLRAAAMGEEPDDWFLVGQEVHWFDDGEEQPLAAPNQPALQPALLRGDPVLLLGPRVLRRQAGETFDELPTLAEWNGTSWDGLFSESILGIDTMSLSGTKARLAWLDVDDKGRLWMAQTYLSRLRQFSPAGRVLTDLTTSSDEPEQLGAEERAAVRDRLSGHQKIAPDASRPAPRRSVEVMTTKPVQVAVTAARDGNVYLIAKQGGRELLQRWNPIEQQLTEVELDVGIIGIPSMALGRDGLVIAQWDAAKGRFLVPAEELEDAAWRAVETVSTNELEQSVSEDADEGIADEAPRRDLRRLEK